MYVSKFKIRNYKSYRETDEIELKPGFNIIVGQNSAGKTALLKALQLQLDWSPHRSIVTAPDADSPNLPTCSVKVSFAVEPSEVIFLLRQFKMFHLAEPSINSDKLSLFRSDPPAFIKWILSHRLLTVTVRVENTDGSTRWVPDGPHFGVYDSSHKVGESGLFFQIEIKENDGFVFHGQNNLDVTNNVTVAIASNLGKRIYRFVAERYNIGESNFGHNTVLASNAANLPEVLDCLTANTARFERFNLAVREIFPQVKHISIRNFQNRIQVIVWPVEYDTERIDLAIPLDQCGSGIGQVLAILYVTMNSDTPQVILVDEPQNFLHPGAIRKLIEVLKRYPQHQYIFTTHSPAVITAADPVTLTVARYSDGETTLQTIDPSNAKHAREYLSEIGARLSDVFGADHVLWVEGQTEEDCIPLILKLMSRKHHQQVSGIAVVGIRQVGGLQGRRDRKKVLEIYNRLSAANTILPPTIAFLFDEECLNAEEREGLRKMGKGQVYFLTCRMYENYLLDGEAVAAVINGIKDFRPAPVSAQELNDLFLKKRGCSESGRQQLKYFCKGVTQVPDDWEKIHAADLLEDIFAELSENRVPYEKTTHSVELTKWIIEHKPEMLKEIIGLLSPIIFPAIAVNT